jgi:molybdopterin-guanine dinucleotide biosynthesis protein A
VSRLVQVCGDVVVVIAPNASAPSLPSGARLARDATEGEGPLAGLDAGLRDVTTTFAIVAGGDMPDLQRGVLERMLDEARTKGTDAVALADGGEVRPLPCVLRAERAADAARTLLRSGRRSVRDLLDALHVTVIAESTWRAVDPAGLTLFDVDEPADLST